MYSELLNVSLRMQDSKARELRRRGYIPGIIYGSNSETIPVIFDKKTVENFIKNMDGNAIFEVSLEGELKPVRFKQVQRDPVTRSILHVDLQHVIMDQKLKAKVPLKYEGIREIKRKGMILQHQKGYIEVEGMAADIPSHLTVSLQNISGSHSIRVQDIEVSEELSIIDSRDEIIASVLKTSNETPVKPEKKETVDDNDNAEDNQKSS